MKNFRDMPLAAGLLASIAILAFSYYRYASGQPERRFQEELIAVLVTNTPTIRPEDLTVFSWDKVCAFVPYISQKEIERISGKPFARFDELIPWADNDGYWSLVFLAGDVVVLSVRIPRMEFGDYELGDDWGRCELRGQALFRVTVDGRPGLAPRKIELINGSSHIVH